MARPYISLKGLRNKGPTYDDQKNTRAIMGATYRKAQNVHTDGKGA